ncbi:MAG TPA: hypothetical protein VGN42_04195 [Pirellulales bacterium]|jgi:hypothetical protein|nr:hypothetical protein [Pirellulales bacterium]
MSGRRFQFRLRTLLVLIVVICIALGSWHLYWNYFGPYIEAESATVGQPIKIRGRFFDFRGPLSTVYVVNISQPMADGRPLIYQSGGGRTVRSGWWAYDVEIELHPVRKAGRYDIELLPLTKAVSAAGKTKTPGAAARARPGIRGTIRVQAPEDAPRPEP